MDYESSDNSGTDDDLPPSHQNRAARAGRVTGNGRPAVMGGVPYTRPYSDMETQIHQLEQEAYCSVLRAFKAQSDAITWDKESLITELRKELRVTDDEHRVLLGRVNADDIIRRIREWRQAGGVQTGFLNNPQPVHDPVRSPTVSASRKKQKTSQPIPPLSLGVSSPALHSQAVTTSIQPSPASMKRGGPPMVARGKKSKSVAANGPADPSVYDHQLIGRKVLTRWPEDNNFYEAVITDYKPAEGLHALVYDMNTNSETWEWVDLKEISPEDIRWEVEDPGVSRRVGRGGPVRGSKKVAGRGGSIPGAGRGRGSGSLKNLAKKEFPSSQNGIEKKVSDVIEILDTDALVKEVERVFSSVNPDPLEMEKAKKALKDHEQSLIEAITRLAEASDGESDEHQYSQDWERQWKNRSHPGNDHASGYHMMTLEGDQEEHVAVGMTADYRQIGGDGGGYI